jgi:hypothetical protein
MTDTIQVASFRTRLDAELAARALDALHIPYVINSAEGMAHGPMPPGAVILVRGEHAARARKALEKKR